jgi:hypothetical protein
MMENVYDKLIEQRLSVLSEGQTLECQVTFKTGMVAAGALYRSGVEGLYAFRTLLRRGDATKGPVDAVDVFFRSDEVALLAIPVAPIERSGLVTPSGEPVLPKPPRM